MTALVATPVIVASGIAIDMITAYATRTEMQNAADAAVLAAASSGETETAKLKTIAQNSFQANFKSLSPGHPHHRLLGFVRQPHHIESLGSDAVDARQADPPGRHRREDPLPGAIGQRRRYRDRAVLDNTYSNDGTKADRPESGVERAARRVREDGRQARRRRGFRSCLSRATSMSACPIAKRAGST